MTHHFPFVTNPFLLVLIGNLPIYPALPLWQQNSFLVAVFLELPRWDNWAGRAIFRHLHNTLTPLS